MKDVAWAEIPDKNLYDCMKQRNREYREHYSALRAKGIHRNQAHKRALKYAGLAEEDLDSRSVFITSRSR